MTTTPTTTPTDPTGPPGPPPSPRHLPVQIAADTWVIQDTEGEGIAPMTVHMNSMVIRGAEPVVVDTGLAGNRDRYLEDLFGLVEPEDVRWVFLSHDDPDHYGNLSAVMAACPNATLVANWFMCERLTGVLDVPPMRWRWLSDGEALDAGDRTLSVLRPPLYDSPTTRGLFDPTTGVYWASDCYGAPIDRGTAFADDVDPEAWAAGLATFAHWNSPWISLVDQGAYEASCRRIEDLPITAIASCHGPTIPAGLVDRAHDLQRNAPAALVEPQPGAEVLALMVAAITGASPPAG